MTADDLTAALDALESAKANIMAARADAITASVKLAGARQRRADELANKLAGCLVHVQRLAVIVLGDIRAAD